MCPHHRYGYNRKIKFKSTAALPFWAYWGTYNTETLLLIRTENASKRLKAEVAAEAVRQINPALRIVAHSLAVGSQTEGKWNHGMNCLRK